MRVPWLMLVLVPACMAQVKMGHIHLNVSDVDAQLRFWTTQFDATPLPGGVGVQVPGMQILFNHQSPTAGTEGTGLDHFGFKVRNRDEMVAKARASGYTITRVFTGSEGFPNAYVLGPDNLRVEMQEASELTVSAVAQHLHFLVPAYWELRTWYVDTFGMTVTTRGPHISADIAGMNLTFATSKTPNNRPTRGGLIDHIAFEVGSLATYCGRPQVTCTGNTARMTDPNGVSIELTAP